MTRIVTAMAVGVLLYAMAVAQNRSPEGEAPREDAYRQNNLGVARLEQYDYAGAVTAFRRALQIQGDLAIARLNLALALFYDGQLEAAAGEARTAAARLPAMPQPHFVLGLIARADSRLDEAAASFQRVIDMDSSDAGARVQLGQVRLAQRRFADAVALFERALELEPFNATAAYGFAQALTRAGEEQRGQAAMQRFQRLRDNPAAITYSATYLEQGRYAEAIVSTGLEPDVVQAAVPTVTFVDASASMLPGRLPPVRDLTLSDLDADGDYDLVLVADESVQVLRNTKGRYEAAATVAVKGGRSALAADYDNDEAPDLLVLTDRALALFRGAPGGAFRDVTQAALPSDVPAARTAAFVDADHDGDLDIVAGSRLLRNNGNGRFVDVSAEARLTAMAGLFALVPTDYDNRRDVDLLLVGREAAPALFSNQRDGTFRDVATEIGLPPRATYTSVAVADVNKDLAPDFFFARSNAPGVFALSVRGGRYALADAPADTANASTSLFVDYDNDGLADLFAWTAAGPRLWRSVGSRWVDVSSPALPAPLVPDRELATSMSAADLDGDGDEDLVVRLSSGQVRVWRNDGGSRNHSLRVRLTSRVSNRSAAGAKVELRSGSLRQKIETAVTTPAVAPADILFGLGPRAKADVVRVLWPAGIVQAETEIPSAQMMAITELDRKPSSCPFLFTWNGSRFEFVTDFMGGGEMGYWVAPGAFNVPDPDEYVRIPAGHLQAREGKYELRITNELEEALFIDRLQLLVVAHSADVDVHPNEGLRSLERRDPFTVYTVRDPRPPLAAVDEHGHDVLDRVAERDRRYVDDFRRASIQGYADSHAVTIDTGATSSDARVLLLLTGWTDYAFSSDNVAAHQAGLAFHPPELLGKTAAGTWETVIPEVGVPVGRPQTIVVDLTAHTRRGIREFRVVTTLRVYWDQILVDRSTQAPLTITRIDAAEATLRWRGFSAEISPDGRAPFGYDYDRVSPLAPWKLMPGRYTREGDVKPLVGRTDDQFVIAAPGDELAVAFDATMLPVLPEGWTRTFLLFADGFSKEMNLHSSSPDTLEPLPFHGMTAYPYPAGETYPTTTAHQRYRETYNTRVISRRVPTHDRPRGTQ